MRGSKFLFAVCICAFFKLIKLILEYEGPPGQVAAVAGKKAGMKQGELGGILKELGYTEDQVLEFYSFLIFHFFKFGSYSRCTNSRTFGDPKKSNYIDTKEHSVYACCIHRILSKGPF